MVKYEYIVKAMDLYITKCPTIKEIQQKLEQMSYREKKKLLVKNGLLNEGELEHYEKVINELKYADRIYEVARTDEEWEALEPWMTIGVPMPHNADYLVEKYSPIAFEYEKRIFNGYKPKTPKEIDPQVLRDIDFDYTLEKQYRDKYAEPIRKVERRQITDQEKITFTEGNCNAISDYFHNGYQDLNSYLNDGHRWNKYTDEERIKLTPRVKKMDRELHDSIGKTNGLVEDTILFHGGDFDVKKVVGDKVKFKGYVSSSYHRAVADSFSTLSSYDGVPQYVYKIALPKGTKGLCANAKFKTENGQYQWESENGNLYGEITGHKYEHEYILDKGSEFEIIDIDYETHTVTLVPNGD